MAERHDLGTYEAQEDYVCAKLKLQGDFSDGHISPKHGYYYPTFTFWSGTDGSSVEVSYCAYGFGEVFGRVNKISAAIDSVVRERVIPEASTLSGLVDRCLVSLKEQTRMLAEATEPPPRQQIPSTGPCG